MVALCQLIHLSHSLYSGLIGRFQFLGAAVYIQLVLILLIKAWIHFLHYDLLP